MSKELEAFKGLLNQLFPDYNVDVSFDNICNLNANLNIISNALKALEIIKEKNVNIRYLQECRFEDYNLLVEEDEELTKKEYDLLKEELK